jgi:D-amino-acid dehydrogenase
LRWLEPALGHARDRIVGGLRTPNDETGDCFKFTDGLENAAARLGVTFRYGETIKELEVEHGQARGILTTKGVIRSEAIVVALGSYSPLLLEKLGIRLPVYPIKGY